MAEILLVNPRRRRKSRRVKAHRRHRRVARVRRRHVAVRANPRRRRRHVSVRRRRYAHNPSFRSLTSGFMPTLKAGAQGATGAILNDLLTGYTKGFLPAMLQTGYPAMALKLVYPLATGYLVNMILRGKGRAYAEGAMTVAIHDIAKSLLVQTMPSLPLSGLGEYMSYGAVVGNRNAAPRVRGVTGATYRPVGQYLSGLGDSEYTNGIPTGSS